MKKAGHDLRNQIKHQLLLLLVSLLSLIGFLFVALLKNSFTTLDVSVSSWAISIQTSVFTPLAEVIDLTFNTPTLLIITLSIAAVLFYRQYWKHSVLLMGAMLGDALIVALLKLSVQSVRPLEELLYDRGFSFPSGHTAGSVVFFGLLTYFAWKYWGSSKVKILSSGLSVLVTAIVGFDRIYLNVHWFSDVVGGYLVGIFWLTFSILMFQWFKHTVARADMQQETRWRSLGRSWRGATAKCTRAKKRV